MANPSYEARRLTEQIARYDGCAVAFSGGVDSTVVLRAARLAQGDRVVAVTGVGPALAAGELEEARRLAAQIGVDHVEVATSEGQRAGYLANGPDRCYHCKTDLYEAVAPFARRRGLAVIANGANADDLGDHRPGMRAAEEFAVRSPLAECGFGKSQVRALAAHWDLSVADKPAAPCLASRVAYGVPVTPERLRRIDAAEQWLRELGLREVRVRCHEGELARIEAPAAAIPRLADLAVREQLVEELTRLGFKFVTIDLAGFRSGSLNAVLPVESLARWSRSGEGPAREAPLP